MVKAPDLASLPVAETLAALQVNPETGLTYAEVETRLKENGFNEVPLQKRHPIRMFLGKFWGLSAWMIELIMALSAMLGKYSDLAVVNALLMVNAVLSFTQEPRAAGREAAAYFFRVQRISMLLNSLLSGMTMNCS